MRSGKIDEYLMNYKLIFLCLCQVLIMGCKTNQDSKGASFIQTSTTSNPKVIFTFDEDFKKSYLIKGNYNSLDSLYLKHFSEDDFRVLSLSTQKLTKIKRPLPDSTNGYIFSLDRIGENIVLNEGYAESLVVKVCSNDCEVIQNKKIEDIRNTKILLSTIEFVEPSSKFYLVELPDINLKDLNVRGNFAFFIDDDNLLVVDVLENKTVFKKVDLKNGVTKNLTESVGSSLRCFAFNKVKNEIYASRDGMGVFVFDLGTSKLESLYSNSVITPIFIQERNEIIFISEDKKSILSIKR